MLVQACATWRAPTPAELQRILAAAPRVAAAQATTAEITMHSERLNGTFSGVLASECAGRARLQLFPDVGGKILDLYADPQRVLGVIPQAGVRIDGPANDGTLPRHVLVFFAITLLEHETPLIRERVLLVRDTGGSLLVQLAPRIFGSEVEAELGADGRLLARHYRYRHVIWHEQVGEPIVVAGTGFHLTARVIDRAPMGTDERIAAFAKLP